MISAEPWGKFVQATGSSHHLAHHCADVAACFINIARISVFRSRLEIAAGRPLSEVDIERLGVLVFMHDAGKLHPGFQSKGWPPNCWTAGPFGHVREGLEIFLAQEASHGVSAAKSLCIDDLAHWGVGQSLLRAVISHHGRPVGEPRAPSQVKRYWRSVHDYDPDRSAAVLGDAAKTWFPAAFGSVQSPLPDRPQFDHLMCGLTALADWIGSDADKFKFVGRYENSYLETAQRRAARSIEAIGLDTRKQRAERSAPASFREVSGHEFPNPQQRVIGHTDINAQLVILEAETGSGKTESALLRYIQLFEAGHVDGLYFAVPTRAAAAQLHRRVDRAAKRLFATADPQVVLAVPGYMRAGSAEGQKLPHWSVRWDDDADTKASDDKIAARWAAEHSTRYLAAQIAVGTVDQAMLGALKVKHAHLRTSSLSRSLLVIDEVHASDRFMTAIQKRLLDEHLSIGGYAMLMSATLGSSARTLWLSGTSPTRDSFDQAVARPYPAIWTNLWSTPKCPDEQQPQQKQVAMQVLATMAPEVTAAQALDAARSGARVLVIRNTVKRANETLLGLEKLLEPDDSNLLFRVGDVAAVHHSRFAPQDRQLLDKAAEAALAPDKNRALAGRIIIGSQTLEQSLDIDADILITDLCPVDVLLQRIGRLHRHTLPRPPGFEIPQCLVMVPEQGLERLLAPNFDNGLGAWISAGSLEGVYRDVAILELTRRLVGQYATWSIPAMNRFLVESATHPDKIDALNSELGTAWTHYHSEVLGADLAKASGAQGIMIDRRLPFEDCQFPNGADERIRTRLGAEGARIVFIAPLPASPFDQNPITEVVLPAFMSGGIGPDDVVVVTSRGIGEFTFSVGQRSFRYDRFGMKTN
jgi:CRISPR-associated endonuclease/helicase Cas3